jgi:hypothetical protein
MIMITSASPSREVNSYSASQEIHCILWNPKVYKSLPLDSRLSQMNSVHITPLTLFSIYAYVFQITSFFQMLWHCGRYIPPF